ncbi:MAG: hypothetical protein P3B98_10715 [Gemmatimonadota bacterium]|nr:hypothetical protein [Gemmatimonadota bacterium]
MTRSESTGLPPRESPPTPTSLVSPDVPLESLVFDAEQLMAEHPPVLHDRNKQVVFDIACPTGCKHRGRIAYAQWPELALPARVVPSLAVARVDVHEGIFDYVPSALANAFEWHVNFADPNLFGAYGSALFAQDEMQVAEHPVLGALREALKHRKLNIGTMSKRYRPTPVLVIGAERRCQVAVDANAAEGRPAGLYGRAFGSASVDAVRRATTRIDPPTRSNIIAMAAPYGMSGRYHPKDIEFVLVTAYSAFRAAVITSTVPGNAPVVVHTGYWGCGAFGGNRVLMTLLQVVAAQLAGVSALVFYTVTSAGRAECDLALEKLRRTFGDEELETADFVARVAAMGFRWGTSDGN